MTFDRALKPHHHSNREGRPLGEAFTVAVTASDGGTRTLTGDCGVTGLGKISGKTVSVSLCGTARYGETATVSYDKSKAEFTGEDTALPARLRGTGGAEVASFTNLPVTNSSPEVFVLSNIIGADVGGSTLTLVHDQALKENTITPGSALAVTAGSRT